MVLAASDRCQGAHGAMRLEASRRDANDGSAKPLWPAVDASEEYFLVPRDAPAELVACEMSARRAGRLHVAIDCSFEGRMTLRERKSLATQITICHGLAADPAHRRHAALALCSLAHDGSAAGGPPYATRPLLMAAGLGSWQGVLSTSHDVRTLAAEASSIVYLSPDAAEPLDTLREDEVYVIGGLIDRKDKACGASLERAAELGARARRLPILEALSVERRARSDSLDMLNVNAVFRILLEYARCRSWPEALHVSLESTQRGYTPVERHS